MSIVQEIIPDIFGDAGIASFDQDLTFEDALAVAGNQNIRTLQTRVPINIEVWSLINDVVLRERSDIKLRIYRYPETCDLDFLPLLSNARNLSIDTIIESKNLENLSKLRNLHSLRIGVSDLESFDFLSELGTNLQHLTIEKTKSNKPNLQFLRGFGCLRSIRIQGHNKDIEILGDLESLTEVSLSGIKISGFEFLRSLRNLESLNIDLLKCENFLSIEGLMIKSIGVSEIRNLSDISFVSSFQSLQNLFLSDLSKVANFPSLPSSNNVRRLFIDNLKSLNNIDNVIKCENLVDFVFRAERTPLTPENFHPVTELEKLRYASIGTGSVRKNEQIDEYLKVAGIERYQHYDFIYEQ